MYSCLCGYSATCVGRILCFSYIAIHSYRNHNNASSIHETLENIHICMCGHMGIGYLMGISLLTIFYEHRKYNTYITVSSWIPYRFIASDTIRGLCLNRRITIYKKFKSI